MGKFERMMAEFAKELLVTLFVMTVFVQAGGTAFGTRKSWGVHIGEPALSRVGLGGPLFIRIMRFLESFNTFS